MPPENPQPNGQPLPPQQPMPPVPPQPIQPDVPQPLPPQAFLPNYDNPQAQPPPSIAQHFDTSQQVRPAIAPESYDFIVNPEKPRKTMVALPSGLKQRILFIAVAVVVLIIIISLVSSLLKPKNNTLPALLAVADQQQELIHLSDPANMNNTQNISGDTANTINTINQSVTSAQGQLLTYLAKNGTKLKTGQVAGANEVSIDATLSTAASGGNYEATLLSTLQTQLSSYGVSLKSAYTLEKGPKGQALLTSDYKQQQLLLTALSVNGNPAEQD